MKLRDRDNNLFCRSGVFLNGIRGHNSQNGETTNWIELCIPHVVVRPKLFFLNSILGAYCNAFTYMTHGCIILHVWQLKPLVYDVQTLGQPYRQVRPKLVDSVMCG